MFSKTPITPSSVEILNKVVSYQKNTWSAFSKEITIGEVLKEIQSDFHKSQVQNLRYLLQQNKRDEYPYPSFSTRGLWFVVCNDNHPLD